MSGMSTMAAQQSRASHPVYPMLHSKIALQNNPELIELIGSRTASGLLMQLAHHQNTHHKKSPWFFRKQSDLAAELGVSVKTIRRAIRHLESMGLVATMRMRLEKQRSKSVNFYHVDFQRIKELLDEQHARHALQAAGLDSTPVTAVVGEQAHGDQSVKMTDSILEIHHNATCAYKPDGRQRDSVRSGNRKGRRTQRRDTRPERALANNPVDSAMGQLRNLANYGYDKDYNPADPRLPNPGEAEALVRARFDTIPNDMINWLQKEAVHRPLQDIRTAITMAQKDFPENVILIANDIRQLRRYQHFAALHPDIANPIRWGG